MAGEPEVGKTFVSEVAIRLWQDLSIENLHGVFFPGEGEVVFMAKVMSDNAWQITLDGEQLRALRDWIDQVLLARGGRR